MICCVLDEPRADSMHVVEYQPDHGLGIVSGGELMKAYMMLNNWCEENCSTEWWWVGGGRFQFSSLGDATIFRLRFG